MALFEVTPFAERQFCRWPGCITEIPADRAHCYFHSRPPARSTDHRQDRYGHVLGHLREQDRPLLEHLITALTHEEIAALMGPGWTRRMVELGLLHINESLCFDVVSGPRAGLHRLAILRIVSGYDRCFCGY